MRAAPRGLAANARPFRYGFYPAVALGFLLFAEPEPWRAAVVAAACGLWPPVADGLSRVGVALRRRRLAKPRRGACGRGIPRAADARQELRLHLLEAALASFLFAASGFPATLLGVVSVILVMSNALQGGLWQALKAIGCAAPALAGGLLVSPALVSPSGMAAFAGLLLLTYCTLVAHVAYVRLLATQGERTEIRALNARLQQYLPHTLARRLGGADRPRLERRWLVVVFADLAGFTRLVERLQMEELATMLDTYLQCIASVTQQWGGAVSKVVGDGALLVFGEEGARSHRQLVADALGCCRNLSGELEKLTANWQSRGLPGAAWVKIGVSSGYCSLGDWGGGGRLEYTVIGYPVNLASRLQSLAAAGEVLLCERTSLLAEAPLSPGMRRKVKGLGEVLFRKVDYRADGAPHCTPMTDCTDAREGGWLESKRSPSVKCSMTWPKGSCQ